LYHSNQLSRKNFTYTTDFLSLRNIQSFVHHFSNKKTSFHYLFCLGLYFFRYPLRPKIILFDHDIFASLPPIAFANISNFIVLLVQLCLQVVFSTLKNQESFANAQLPIDPKTLLRQKKNDPDQV